MVSTFIADMLHKYKYSFKMKVLAQVESIEKNCNSFAVLMFYQIKNTLLHWNIYKCFNEKLFEWCQ